MSTFTNLLYHVVYSTKYRRPSLTATWRDDLYGYIGGIVREQKGTLLRAGGVEDHIHLLVKLSPTLAISDVLRTVKANSSRWINERSDVRQRFEWQSGYAAFSVSESMVAKVIRYIDNQEAHHRKKTFEEEFLEILQRHGVNYDPRYVFEREIIN